MYPIKVSGPEPCLIVLLVSYLALVSVTSDEATGDSPFYYSQTDKYRVVWVADPSTEAVIAWNQTKGEPATVHYGAIDEGRVAAKYSHAINPQRVQQYDGMKNCFAKLSGLDSDTRYFFCLKDEYGISRRLYFHTAPAKPKPFTFISGGDSRNFRDVRVLANQFAERLRPLFIAFTGDMINQDVAEEWEDWLNDWQHTISSDGRMIPFVPHRGNHERRPETIRNFFHTPRGDYFAFNIGGGLFRYYALNSEIPANGPQENWLEQDLQQHASVTTHLVAGYHKPMRPHVSKKSEGENPMHWADNFYRHGLDLALESDSHVIKRTLPLKPDSRGPEGFTAAPGDPRATVYIGEGCWGAPLRAADDPKPWTIATESFNGFDWIRVSQEKMEVKTVRVEGNADFKSVEESNLFAEPEGMKLWQAGGEIVLTIPSDR
ncbi:MAG: metallophosphoesterase family protein [Verrucomicrobiota bacterium]